VKLLKDLEEQEGGPVLLSAVAFQASRNTMSGSFSMAEDNDALLVIELLRDMTSPLAYFKPQASGTDRMGSSADRRPSFNDLMSTSSPFAVAVLLTQMWWALCATIEHNEDEIPDVDPGEGIMDDDASFGSDASDTAGGSRAVARAAANNTALNRVAAYVDETRVEQHPDGLPDSSDHNASKAREISPPAMPMLPPSLAACAGYPKVAEPPQGLREQNDLVSSSSSGKGRGPPGGADQKRTPAMPTTGEAPTPARPVSSQMPQAPPPHPSPLRYILQRKGAPGRIGSR
jgi:hypothetical protein